MRRLVALAGLLLVLSACSDDPEPTPSASPSGSADQPSADASSAGCDGQRLEGTDVARSLTIGDTTWKYGVHVPPGYDARTPLPVVYLYHGLGGEATSTLGYTDFANAANTSNFVVVTPQANGDPTTWDVVTPVTEKGSDVDFALQLTKEVTKDWCVDPDRQYAAGVSNGSAMMFAMACSGAFDIQAYGAVAATFYVPDRCGDAPPMSFVYFHGTADEVVPFDGGETPLFPVRAVPDVLADWAEHDGCRPDPAPTQAESDVELTTWSGCDDGARMEAYVVDGGGHTWPGAPFPIPILGKTTNTVDATDVMVDFFGLARS